MEQSPITDRTLGVMTKETKFAEVRARSYEDERVRNTSRKKRKHVPEALPKYSIGDEVVVARGYKNKEYCLVEVIDIEPKRDAFMYYAIVKETTNKKMVDRIGRLCRFEEYQSWSWDWDWLEARCRNENFKWIEHNK